MVEGAQGRPEVTSELRPEENEGIRHVGKWRKVVGRAEATTSAGAPRQARPGVSGALGRPV